MRKYSEQVNRYAAVTEEGKPCEVLERITFARTVREDGSPGEPREISRRFDLRTGECLRRIGETQFEDEETGARILLKS